MVMLMFVRWRSGFWLLLSGEGGSDVVMESDSSVCLFLVEGAFYGLAMKDEMGGRRHDFKRCRRSR